MYGRIYVREWGRDADYKSGVLLILTSLRSAPGLSKIGGTKTVWFSCADRIASSIKSMSESVFES